MLRDTPLRKSEKELFGGEGIGPEKKWQREGSPGPGGGAFWGGHQG